jgi:DNA repair exonuclease SbcCD ATPase subunit
MAIVTQLVAANFKRIRAVKIEFDGGGVVQISGENGAGKSSVLDALFAAIGGKKAAPADPVRHGEKEATIEVHLDDPKVIISRSFTPDGKTELKIESRAGERYPSPQAMLDKLFGKLAFDPGAFMHLEAKQRIELLLSVVTYKVDAAKLEELAPESEIEDPIQRLRVRFESIYQDRTVEGRVHDQLKGELAALEAPREDDPKESVNISDVVAKRDEMKRLNAVWQSNLAEFGALVKEATDLAARLKLVEERRDQLKAILDTTTPPDWSALDEQIENAEAINERIAAARRYENVAERLDESADKIQAKTAHLDRIKSYKEELVRTAVMPVQGLGFDKGDVTFDGVPFEQASQAQKVRVSAGIAMALNPALKVMLVRDGAFLSEKSLALLAEIAAEKEYLVLVETVDTSGTVGIVIDDGAIAATNAPKFPPKKKAKKPAETILAPDGETGAPF